MNNNTTKPKTKKDLAKATGTTKGTAEHSSLKTVHREYNKLNGFEAMIHIINRFRFVLYPFIFLSIAGSSYSFYNDFIKAFPMLGDTMNLTIAIFFSAMLEIFRDGSLIALFNAKMNKPSRLLVSGLFVAVTTYMYSSHLKAIDVIEEMAVEYTLLHQDDNKISATSPKFDIATEDKKNIKADLTSAKNDLLDLKLTLKEQRALSTGAKYKANREKATKEVTKIELKIEKKESRIVDLKAQLKDTNANIVKLKNDNIDDVKDSQKLISQILLATLLLIESLAMLGAVIKFIYKDNAQKEIAKHSEIIEEYVEISEQMKQSNEDLTKALSNVAQAQSDSSKQTTEFLTKDLRTSSENNMKILKAVAENRDIMISQMYEAIEMMAKTSMPNFAPQAQFERVAYQESQPKQIEADSKTDMINLILDNVSNVGDKISPKTQLVDVKKRSETKMYETAMKELTDLGVVDYKRGRGYFLSMDIDKAVGILSGDEPTTHQIGFKTESQYNTLLKAQFPKGVTPIEDFYNNHGVNYAYLYKGYLIHKTSETTSIGNTYISIPQDNEITFHDNRYRLLNYKGRERDDVIILADNVNLETAKKTIDAIKQ